MTLDCSPQRPWQQLHSCLANAWPPQRWCDVGVVVGCSGGADSVALLRALCAIRELPDNAGRRGFLVVAHFNHRLRGEESDQDQAFVSELAQRLQVDFVTDRSDEPVSDESSLRSARRKFLKETAEKRGARYVCVAHSADDNAETILHHLMRGTGPIGLAGIRSPRPLGDDIVLIRPLLQASRCLIREALREIGQDWREDSSNRDVDYRRNWIRHELIPMIESQFPKATEAICRAGQTQASWCDWMDREADRWLDDCRESDTPLRLIRGVSWPQPVVIAGLQRLWSEHGWPRGSMTQSHWLRLAEALGDGEANRRYDLPGGIQVDVGERVVILLPPRDKPAAKNAP